MEQTTRKNKSKGTFLSCIRPHLSQEEDDADTDTSPNRQSRHERCVSDAVSFELQWSRSRDGVNAVGKCVVIDLYDNDTDARNYAKAFRAAGFEINFMNHPSDKVEIELKFT